MIYAGNAKKLYGLVAEQRPSGSPPDRSRHAFGIMPMARHVVAPVDDIPPGGRKLVEVNGRAVVVFNLGGEFFALNNRCPHRGGSLCEGKPTGLVQSSEPGEYQYSRKGEIIRCPWHSGSSTSAPGNRGATRSACARGNTRCRSKQGRATGRRPIQGRDVSGQRRERVRGGRGVSGRGRRARSISSSPPSAPAVKVVAIDARPAPRFA